MAKTKSKKRAAKVGGLQTLHKFSFMQLMVVAIVFSGAGAYLTYLSFAASKSYSGTIKLATPDPYLGSTVSFLVDISPKPTAKPTNNSNPRTVIRCYQDANNDGVVTKNALPAQNGGDMVYAEARNYKDSYAPLGGGGSAWKDRGGPASCTATLYNYIGFGSAIEYINETAFEAGGAR